MAGPDEKGYIKKRMKLSSFFFETALPNEYLVQLGKKNALPVLGGRRFKLFKRFLRVPASVQTVHFSTDNANVNYQGIGVDGYAAWRIDAGRPEVAIAALDFFDEEDPVGRTNAELATICKEAVRHLIANMSIEDALQKKDEIGLNLKQQLERIEKKWGIIFDQVGIEKVRIMSDTLFKELQAPFRESLRLEAARKKIETDKQILAEENNLREKSEMEKIETDHKIQLSVIDNQSGISERQIAERKKQQDQERLIAEEQYRAGHEFDKEKTQKENLLMRMKKENEISIHQDLSKKLLELELELGNLQSAITVKELELDKLRREIALLYNQESLQSELITKLPEIFSSIHIDQYTVFDSGENGISPVSRILTEILTIWNQNKKEAGT